MQKYDFIKKQYTPYTPPQNGHCDIMVHANEELNCAAVLIPPQRKPSSCMYITLKAVRLVVTLQATLSLCVPLATTTSIKGR